MFRQESLELLRSRIDLIEVLSPHLKLQRAGAAYKALCPFHDEKTPSFVVQRGDTHYHCFGCGAHGDAIAFLMNYLRMSFTEAVQSLADRFGVFLEEGSDVGPNKKLLKEALEKAARFYHFYLLHTEEGHEGLSYLYSRGIDLDFIRAFTLGYAPKYPLMQKVLREEKVGHDFLLEAGLIKLDSMGKERDFFSERIMIPIHDAAGSVIGFTARKLHEETFGPKYINTAETPLFKKSRILFGLSYSRKRIAKEKKAIIVEGQFDALRLIHAGFTYTVASQGTAFTEDHARELLQLGVQTVFLAFDADEAGQEAAVKVGNLFQKEGVEACVIALPEKTDPDSLLRDQGPDEWNKLVEKAEDYLTFLVRRLSKKFDPQIPAQKNELVSAIAEKIRNWDHPLMIHESLKKLARLTQTPESIIVQTEEIPSTFIKSSGTLSHSSIDPNRVLEADFLRWLFLYGESKPHFVQLAKANLTENHFRLPYARRLYAAYLEEGKPKDLLSFTISLQTPEEQLFLSEMLQKKINPEKAEECYVETIQKILERHWMLQREEIKGKILGGSATQEEVMELAKRFDQIKNERPTVIYV